MYAMADCVLDKFALPDAFCGLRCRRAVKIVVFSEGFKSSRACNLRGRAKPG